MYMRPERGALGTNDLMAVSVSENLLDWSTPRTIMYPDEWDDLVRVFGLGGGG